MRPVWPDSTTRKYLEENAAAVDILLDASDLDQIEAIVGRYPDIGQRYSDGAMKLVNH